jgi:hypothetical protein
LLHSPGCLAIRGCHLANWRAASPGRRAVCARDCSISGEDPTLLSFPVPLSPRTMKLRPPAKSTTIWPGVARKAVIAILVRRSGILLCLQERLFKQLRSVSTFLHRESAEILTHPLGQVINTFQHSLEELQQIQTVHGASLAKYGRLRDSRHPSDAGRARAQAACVVEGRQCARDCRLATMPSRCLTPVG